MKKTTTISLAGTLFHIEEDAYVKLETYLGAIKTHFASHADKDEILSDIESRFAERFGESAAAVISVTTVQAVIDAMGTIEDFDFDAPEAANTKSTKRLYRDIDNRVIAGVAAGLGHYFGIDRTIIRILFIASIFAGGFGIMVYIIFWLVTPGARTNAQKLEMAGVPVTLKSMSEAVRERIDEIDSGRISSGVKDFGGAVERGAQAVGRTVVPWVKTIIGVVVTVGSFIAAVSLSIFAGLGLFRFPQKLFGPEAAPLLQGFEYSAVVLLLYVSIALPVIVVLLWGMGLLRKKPILNKVNVLAFASVWFIALVGAGITTSRLAYKLNDKMNNDPSVVRQTVTAPLEAFDSIVVSDGKNIEVVRGDTYSVQFEGSQRDIDQVSVAVADNVLTIGQSQKQPVDCLFCNRQRLAIRVTVPKVSSITLSDSSSLKADLNFSDLSLTLKDSSRATLSGNANIFTLKMSGSSYFNGSGYKNAYANVAIKDSSDALLNTSVRIVGEVANSSSLSYMGDAKTEIKMFNNSRVRQEVPEM